jgi:hypothetical protein
MSSILVHRPQGGDRLVVEDGGLMVGSPVQCKRFRVTAAEVNAGHTLLAALPGLKYRLVDCTLIAIGGNAATATSVDILATQSSSVKLIAAAVAALTRSTVVKPNTASVTVLADGASHVANDANTAVTIGKTGSNLATATHIDVVLSYTIEE